MESIFSSKLYKASPRKEQIKAALAFTGNAKLVQQLASSLDEEYQKPENFGKEPEKEEVNTESNELFVDEDINPETDLMTVDDLAGKSSSSKSSSSSSSSSGSSSTFKGPKGPKPKRTEFTDVPADVPSDSPDTDLDKLETNESESEKSEAAASTKITSCEQVSLTVLKESLNGREDTKGVSRIAEKENEVWIYYKDEVNLNNLMTEVIEYMMSAGYDSLEFNRLARSDNAIVFQKTEATPEELESIEPQDADEVVEEVGLEGAE